MKEFFRKFLERFKGTANNNRSDLALFLVAVILSFSIWMIHNLALSYSEFVSMPVVARCSLDGHSTLSSNVCEITARCRTTGYGLLSAKRFARHRTMTVDFDRNALHHQAGETYYLTSKELQEYAHVFFGESSKIEYFVTDTAFFRFPFENSKKVPVVLVNSLTFKPQYTMVGDIRLEPDSVTIHGEPSKLEALEKVSTAPVKHGDLSSSVQGMARIKPVKGLRMSDEEVHYSIEVSRYVEETRTIDVRTRNVPAGKDFIVIPSSVDVTLRSVFPASKDPFDRAVFYVDYKDYVMSRSGKCMVRVSGIDESVISWTAEPQVCECVVNVR